MSGGGSLSQEEIDALLRAEPAAAEPAASGAQAGDATADTPAAQEAIADQAVAEDPAAGEPAAAEPASGAPGADLTAEQRDAIGEIGNICMSSAATALSTLLSRPVQITTPTVEVTTAAEIRREWAAPALLVTIEYTEGLDGQSVFLLSTSDAGVVADLMMGGAGTAPDSLTELHLSAIAEAMNQMMGSASTAMAEMAGRRVDISAPAVRTLDLRDLGPAEGIDFEEAVVRTAFQLTVGDLIDTTLMQLMPISFAQSLIDGIVSASATATASAPPPAVAGESPGPPAGDAAEPVDQRHLHALPSPPVAFPSLDEMPAAPGGSDISLLLDVPLQVTVELGRTQLRIRNVLELVPGSIVELDKLAGEPVDVLVNGKPIARGEVVVIDEEFGVRITEVASQAKRLRGLAAE